MKGWAHIILVGASIIANAYRDKVVEWSISELEGLLAKGEVNKSQLISKLLGFVSVNPERASAELNTCMNLILQGYQRGRQQWVYLLLSDTDVGRVCAEVLRRFLERFSHRDLNGELSVEKLVEIKYLGNPERFGDGLANLYGTIIDHVRYHKQLGDVVFIHATGGFKPEAAIAILAANSPGTGAPVFYIHEHFNKTIRIPAIPIKFRPWKSFTELMNYLLIVKSSSRTVLEKKFGGDAVDHAIRLGWIDEKDGWVSPTLMGGLLWRYLQKSLTHK